MPTRAEVFKQVRQQLDTYLMTERLEELWDKLFPLSDGDIRALLILHVQDKIKSVSEFETYVKQHWTPTTGVALTTQQINKLYNFMLILVRLC